MAVHTHNLSPWMDDKGAFKYQQCLQINDIAGQSGTISQVFQYCNAHLIFSGNHEQACLKFMLFGLIMFIGRRQRSNCPAAWVKLESPKEMPFYSKEKHTFAFESFDGRPYKINTFNPLGILDYWC